MADLTVPEPVGFYCDHTDEPSGESTHEGWEWTDEGQVWQRQPTTISQYGGRPHGWDTEKRVCPRAVPVYAVDVPALTAALATARQERQDFAANLEAFLAADPEQRGLSGLLQVERTHRRHAEEAWEAVERERDAALAALEERGEDLARWQRAAGEHQRAMFEAFNERDRHREQRDRARMAVDRAERLADAASHAETDVSAQALADAVEDVASLCPGCWRPHGLWCHPYGGPLADPDPTAYQRAIKGEEVHHG